MKPESAEQSIRVEIYNQNYSIRSDGDNEYIMDLADYVDGKMREIASGTLTVDSLKVAILTALHLAQEYRELQRNCEEKTDEWSRALEQVLKK